MVVPEQYPDRLVYGNKEVKCRFRPARGTKYLKKQDGSEVLFRFDIAFPVGTEPILTGTIVSAFDKSGSVIVYEQELLDFHIGQLHCLGGM
ncbi:hypothetical protein QT327_10510 [Olivibacter sp. 47]|uniref:hypothetical protein n=1 Tax=Olivibacter sp. 47 TaxID=3056486 RepID=UPI0025A389E0|nr:hypothetical protein [Olivibacter sp. 47]MDM8174783.1 hypothetical protein [Olivibacter sp. 47]